MIHQLQETDLALILDFKSRMLVQSGCWLLPRDWEKSGTELYQNLYRQGKCQHFSYETGGRLVALAGALLCDESPGLSMQEERYGMLIDEYVLPEYRNQAIAAQLRSRLLAWLEEKGVRLTTTTPPNTARLACAARNLRW